MKKRAFLVGINSYAGAPLQGCVNDVWQMRGLLVPRGFVSTMLLDAQATKAAILAGLRTLLQGLLPGDVAVFHYSGHGSYVPDLGGDEWDRRDEAIVPVDYAGLREQLITDDELSAALQVGKISPGVNVTLVLDSCFSGTMNRAAPARGQRREASRFLLHEAAQPVSRLWHPWRRYRGPVWRKLGARVTTGATGTTGGLLIACSGENQYSADAWIDGAFHGAGTYALAQAMAKAGAGLTPDGAVRAMRLWLSARGYPQRPGLYGNTALRSSPLFEPLPGVF